MSASQKVILVFRFSAMGDVAMTVPVLRQVVELNPDKQFVMVSDQKFEALFLEIGGLTFEGFDLKLTHKGLLGIFKIFRYLYSKYKIALVVDLNDVLRTNILCALFFLSLIKISVIKKGRIAKAALTRKEGKNFTQLPHTLQRYLECFKRFNIQVEDKFFKYSLLHPKKPHLSVKKIGFAPFAKNKPKIYPVDKMEQVIRHFDKEGFELYFFGNGWDEQKIIDDWNGKFKHTVVKGDLLGLYDELKLISNLDLMVTMDSANMHIASNLNIPVVSIWGPTHPFAGFYGFNQDPSNAVQVMLACRPCSVSGKKPCWRGDHACMEEIKPAVIISKIEELLN